MTDYVEFGGLRFEGSSYSELTYSKLTNWDGRTDDRWEGDSIPGANGSYGRASLLRESRVFTLSANIIADSSERFFDLKRAIEALPDIGEVRVDQGDGVWARRSEVKNIDIPDFPTRTITPFTIDFLAPDPVRYSDMLTAGPVGIPVQSGGLFLPAALPWDLGTLDPQVAVVANTGSLPILPVVRLHGAASSVVVHGGPRVVSFGAFSGELVIDSLQRRAFLNGADVTRQLIQRNWHEVPPGATHGFFFEAVSPSSGLSMTVEYRIGVW